MEDGIVDLRCGRLDYYFNPVPREAMNTLIEDAEREPWPTIVRRFMAHVKENPDWLDDLIVDSRYTWKLGLELPPGAKFLDLGCGLGNLTKNIAPQVGEVVAMDLTWERLRFAKRRFARFNADDRILLVAGGDGPYLPFPDAYFDCVALSGVLEWVADVGGWQDSDSKLSKLGQMFMSFFGDSNPRVMQRKFLQEVRRILRPGGQLFVAIENRLNYEYFGKRADHHTQLWFGSLLPRFLANLYSIVINRQPYRTYTYSLGGCRRLFQSAGFARQEFLGFLDGYTHLSEIIPLKTRDGNMWPPPRPRDFRDRIKRSKHFVPAYGIIASDSTQSPSSLLKRVVGSIESALLADQSPVSIHTCHITGKEKAVLFGVAGTTSIIINIPCNSAAGAAQSRHYGLLERAQGLDSLVAFVPKPMACGVIQNVAYFVESELAGRPLRDTVVSGGRPFVLAEVSRLLRAINPAPQESAQSRLVGADFHRLVEQPLQKVLAFVDDRQLAKEVNAGLSERLRGIPVRYGLVHGDFSVQNIFADDGRVNGLIDWEDVDACGLPILDALNYLESAHRACNPHLSLLDTISLLAKGVWPVKEEEHFLENSYEYLGFDAKYHLELAALYWLYHVGPQLEFSLGCNRPEIRQRVELVARELLRLI
ncbi:MAG: methyltransferase domain-containing protein [Candidatus Accumulibacter sp.]|uniref:Methyltransferase domain-containing protein n=1 Tax=Candidatus Accumulibacter proximus TaxID=2954385 RepID=A0A935PXY6_9PROT|nr:methyltransferase domain-containing protein [Candidatus Accumulibacter proximus]